MIIVIVGLAATCRCIACRGCCRPYWSLGFHAQSPFHQPPPNLPPHVRTALSPRYFREIFSEFARELTGRGDQGRAVVPLLCPTSNAVTGVGEGRDLHVAAPGACSLDALRMFRVLGRLVGCALRTGVRLAVAIAPPFWKVGGVYARRWRYTHALNRANCCSHLAFRVTVAAN